MPRGAILRFLCYREKPHKNSLRLGPGAVFDGVGKADTISNGSRFVGLPFEALALIASAKASLVGARAALCDRLRVFLPWQSYGKNDL